MRNLIVFIFLLLSSLQLFAQEKQTTRKGFNWGINAGMYFANRKEAQFYDGAATRPAKLKYILGLPDYYQEISEALNSNFILSQTGIMKYNPAVLIGLNLQYYTSPKIAYYVNINMVNLKSYGIFKVELLSPSTDPNNWHNTKEGAIFGKENRFNIDAGFHYVTKPIKDIFYPYIDLGFMFSLIHVSDHQMNIAGFSSDMYYSDYVSGSGSLSQGLGYGAQLGLGFQVELSEKYYLFLGYGLDAIDYNLLKNSFTLQHSVAARIMF